MVLVDTQTGHVAYRTPAALDPRYVDGWTGSLLIHAGDRGQNRDLIIGQHESPVPGGWWRLDVSTLTLVRGRPPAYTSPDGQFRVIAEGWRTRVVTTNGRSQYVADRLLTRPALWLGPHRLELQGYSPYDPHAVPPDIELDLETKQARRLLPERATTTLRLAPTDRVQCFTAKAAPSSSDAGPPHGTSRVLPEAAEPAGLDSERPSKVRAQALAPARSETPLWERD